MSKYNSSEESSKGNILIVDDTPDNLRLLSVMLTEQGYQVRKALSGQMALIACRNMLPDLILLDVMMPEMNGYEVCQEIKSRFKSHELPIIFISALDDVLDKVKAFSVGGVDYITKPFQVAEVLARVENQLTIRRLHHQLLEKNNELTNLNLNLERLVEEKSKQLIEQEKSAIIGRLTQGIVHNLKNPLQTILICSELVEIQSLNNQSQDLWEYSQDIQTAAAEIQQIIDNLLMQGIHDQKLELEYLNINEIVENEIKLLMSNLHFKHHVKKKYYLSQTLPSVPLIYTHISQVFHNLVNNALDAMWGREVQELTITTRQDETYLYLEIRDTGCGIDPEHLPKIFDLFYTSKPAKGCEKENGEPTGTGLGLYTCRELLKAFQGDITVTSQVGQGSLFTVSLPKIKPLELKSKNSNKR